MARGSSKNVVNAKKKRRFKLKLNLIGVKKLAAIFALCFICRFVQGVNSDECYVIYHWQLIDMFVYFSHHFVTIPPPCWTNAAHTHGVPVLGTVITEEMKGIEICSNFLEGHATFQRLADQLVNIAEYYRFDGWLLNIENHIEVSVIT